MDNLQLRLDSEKQKRLHLDAYSRRENLRLIGVPEEEDENDEQTEKTETFWTRWVYCVKA